MLIEVSKYGPVPGVGRSCKNSVLNRLDAASGPTPITDYNICIRIQIRIIEHKYNKVVIKIIYVAK